MEFSDLIADMAKVAHRLGPPKGEFGRAVQFVASTPGDGVSSLARAFAMAVTEGSKRGVWLVELDVTSGHQSREMASHTDVYGSLGPAVRASPDGSCFFDIKSDSNGSQRPGECALVAHSVGGRPLWVTRLPRGAVGDGQSVELCPKDDYWVALRKYADWIVVDAPALRRSKDALTVARFMDCNILVLDAQRADLGRDLALRDAVIAAGGRIAGAVLNRSAASDHPRP